MRIIAGEFKYRKLEIPRDIRPTTEKVKEAVFSMLGASINGAAVLDLFAGSGAIGLEALSRGAKSCVFNDISRSTIKILKKNISICCAADRSKVTQCDYKKFIERLETNDRFDIIFVDPPYSCGTYTDILSGIGKSDIVSSEGLVIAEHLYRDALADKYENLNLIKRKKYGTIGIDIYRKFEE